MGFVLVAMRRPVTVLVAILGIVLAAILTIGRTPIDLFPNLNLPVIYVAQPYGGLDPAQMEGYVASYYEYHFLYITGIKLTAVNTGVAVATTASVIQWSLAFGHTAVSLATAEAATTKAARRQPLGVQSFAIADPVGKAAQRVGSASFGKGGELFANPGEFVGIIVKAPVGTATATETFRGVVAFFGYWQLPVE